MHARLLGTKKLINSEIAEPRPNMNIKVAAFTVSEQSSTTLQFDGFVIAYSKTAALIFFFCLKLFKHALK